MCKSDPPKNKQKRDAAKNDLFLLMPLTVLQASYYRDPITFYSHIFSKGIGTRTAALYVAWAQQFEQRGLNEQADAVYRKALENQAQPASSVYHEYRYHLFIFTKRIYCEIIVMYNIYFKRCLMALQPF